MLREAARRRDAATWAGLLHAASLGAAFGFLLWVNRHQWFIVDEWTFLAGRRVLGGEGPNIWQAHNEHWSTTPILVYRGLFAMFGVRTYLPYLLVNIALHLLLVHLVWRLLRRTGIEPLLATSACAVLAVLGAGWENLLSAFQYQFFGPLVLGLAALLVAPERGGLARRDALVALLLVIGLTFSGTALTMAVVVALVTLLRRGVGVAAATAAAPAAVYLVWYLAYGNDASLGAPRQPFTTTLEILPAYIWHGLVNAVDDVTGLAGVGPVALVLLGLTLLRFARPAVSVWAVTLALALGAVIFLTGTGLRRSSLGIENAASPRYVYVIAVLLLPLAALAVDRALSRSQIRLVATLGVTALLLIVQTTQLNLNANESAVKEQEQKRQILVAAELARSGERLLTRAAVPQFSPNLTIDHVVTLDRDGKLPGNVELSEADRLSARAYLQLVLTSTPRLPRTEPLPRLVQVEGATPQPLADPACVQLDITSPRPSVLVEFPKPGFIEIETERRSILRASVIDDIGRRGRPRPFSVAPREVLVLNMAAAGFSVRLELSPEAATELCGLGLSPLST